MGINELYRASGNKSKCGKKGEKYSQENEDGYLYLTRDDVNDSHDGSPLASVGWFGGGEGVGV